MKLGKTVLSGFSFCLDREFMMLKRKILGLVGLLALSASALGVAKKVVTVSEPVKGPQITLYIASGKPIKLPMPTNVGSLPTDTAYQVLFGTWADGKIPAALKWSMVSPAVKQDVLAYIPKVAKAISDTKSVTSDDLFQMIDFYKSSFDVETTKYVQGGWTTAAQEDYLKALANVKVIFDELAKRGFSYTPPAKPDSTSSTTKVPQGGFVF